MSDSLQPHGLYSPWNSPGQNTGMGSLALLREWEGKVGQYPIGYPAFRIAIVETGKLATANNTFLSILFSKLSRFSRVRLCVTP